MFAKLNVFIRNGTYRLKGKIARLVMKMGLQNKRWEKCKLQKNIWNIILLLSMSLLVVVYNAFLHQIIVAVKGQIKVTNLWHGEKLYNLKLKQETTNHVK